MEDKEIILQNKIIKCEAIGVRFISGIASQYDDTYPIELQQYISEENFKKDIDKINEAIAQFWPCSMCYIFGFACAPFTLGTSLCCPHYCISKAESNLIQQLEDISLAKRYYDYKITWSLKKNCFTSWIEIEIPQVDKNQK